jgi:hypothetical protein
VTLHVHKNGGARTFTLDFAHVNQTVLKKIIQMGLCMLVLYYRNALLMSATLQCLSVKFKQKSQHDTLTCLNRDVIVILKGNNTAVCSR